MQLGATGCHRLPKILAQNPTNLAKWVFPPAQECQMAQLGALAAPVEPKWHQDLAADTRDSPNPPKCDSNSSQICHQANKKTSIQASKHASIQASKHRVPEVGGRGGSLFNKMTCFNR